VSSPIRATKRKIQDYAYQQQQSDSDNDHFAKPRHATRDQKSHSRQPPGFDDEFAAVRVAKPPRAAKQPRGLGQPITVDERMAGLDEMQLDVLHDFLNGAKKLRQAVMTNNGHRQTIFSDTVLREMGLRLPADLEEMKAIPGINKDMVDRYGRRFMLLVNNTRDMYGDLGMAPVHRNPQSQHRPAVQELSDDDYEDDDDDDEEVYDPNRQQVIDLCESDEDIPAPEEDLESNYSYSDSDDEDNDDERRSHFFTQAPDPEVEAFNSRLTQTAAANAASSKASAAKRAPRASSSGPKKRFGRKSGGSYGRGGFSGVKKRATSKGTSSKAPTAPKRATGGSSRGGGVGANSRAAGGAGNNGWSSIMGMPT
jgi:bloom syndrome protein